MSSTQYDAFQPTLGATERANNLRADGRIFGQLRRLIGAIAVVLLVALAAYGIAEPPRDVTPIESNAISVGADQQASSAPTFDGRGKWTGYTR